MPPELSIHAVRQRPTESAGASGLPEPRCPVWAMVKAGTPVSSSTVAAR